MIEVRNLSFGYHKKRLLYRDLSMSLSSGSIYGLMGKNGAGKSTLLKTLIGLLFPRRGKIVVNGYEPRRRQPGFLETIYFIPEEVYVPGLTVERYLNLYAPFYQSFNREQFFEYLKVMDVVTKDRLNTLSFGQQKKFIIAFGLACNTRVLLLDEPTNGLDIPSKGQFRKLISSILTGDRIVLISTHQIRDLDNLIDRIIIVDEGQVLLDASIERIASRLSFKTVREMPDDGRIILYAEETLKGTSVVMENWEREDSKVNLEQLFNSVTGMPVEVKKIFEKV
jgi:ABC-2 type transport system ATP-binding protein